MLGGGDPLLSVDASRFDGSIAVGFRGRAGRVRLVGHGLRGGQLRGHLLRGRVSLGAPLVGLGDRGALLRSSVDGFDLGLGRGRVGHRVDGLAQSIGDVGHPVGFGAQQTQQFRSHDRRVGPTSESRHRANEVGTLSTTWEDHEVSSNTFETGVSDYEYRQRIRKYTPSSLLPLIAATAGRYRTQQEWLNSPYRIYTPWALADAARVALTHGTEFGRSEAADQDLLRILDAYNRFSDPFRRDHDWRAFLLRMAGEQLTWQASDYQALARTAAIFSQTAPARPMECVRPGWDTELLGCPLREYVGTAQLVWASAFSCAGRFDLALFDTPDGQLIARHVGRDTVSRVVEAHFAISKDRFRAEDNKVAQRAARLDPELRRFTYNPLRGRPVLTGFGAGYLCPVPQLAWAKATPWGVYFSGLDHYGDRFARDLGHLFEQYIGRQLRLLPDAQVIPEITCGPKASRRKTVDWIVVFSDLVLLVEVKSAIPTEPVRLGTPAAADEVIKKLGKAFSQIDITAQLIEDRDPALASVPADRPILGMAVTLEPFHLANAPFLHDLLPSTRTPVAVAAAVEIEDLVSITDMSAARMLRERAGDAERSTWSLDTVLHGHAHSRNPVLDEAWNSYPWASANRASR